MSKDWNGKSKTGKNTYESGNMYWKGTVDAVVEIPAGESVIMIWARGEPAYGIWPYMVVELDGEEIGERFVNSGESEKYNFKVKTNGGLRVLSVTFPNDGGEWEKGIDRNLYIGEARVIKDVR